MGQVYLLDTNICIYFSKGLHGVRERFEKAGLSACRVSEITVAELLYGAEYSQYPERNKALFKLFLADMEVLPISPCIPVFAA